MTPHFSRVLLGLGLAFAFAACLTPTANPDRFWHLSAGRFIVERGEVPRTDFLSWTKAGAPWVDFEWGTQVIYYGLDRAGGVLALWAFKSAAFAAIVLLFAGFLLRKGLSPGVVGAALPAFALALTPSLDLRPEIASFALCLLQLCVLEARRTGALRAAPRALLAGHVLAYAAWANLHAGFPVGLALCALYGAGEALDGRRDRLWFALAAAGLLGTLANPYGPGLYAVFLDHWRQRSALRDVIVEWAAPNLFNPYHRAYWAVLVFSLLVFARGLFARRPVPAAHLLIAAAFGLFSSLAARQTPYLPLTVFPLALTSLNELESPAWWRRLSQPLLAAVLLLSAGAGIPVLRRERLFERIDSTDKRRPEDASAFLRANETPLAALKMFNSWNYGAYLGGALAPAYKIFMDGRYIFSDQLADFRAAARTPRNWRDFLDSAGVGLVVMEPSIVETRMKVPSAETEVWRPVDAGYMPSRDWALVYWDSKTNVWVRRAAVSAEWLKTREFRYLRPGDLQFLTLAVLSGAAPRGEVLAEIARHEAEVNDPAEAESLARWARELGR